MLVFPCLLTKLRDGLHCKIIDFIFNFLAASINFFSKILLCGSGPDTNTKSCFFVIVLKYLNLDILER